MYELLVMYESQSWYLREGRPISVSAAPVGPGTAIWRSCRFWGCLLRSLSALPRAALGLCHVGWERSGHGLTSRPLETAGVCFLSCLLSGFGYPEGCGAAMLEGALPRRHCSARFAVRKPSWKLPLDKHVRTLLTGGGPDVGLVDFSYICARCNMLCDEIQMTGERHVTGKRQTRNKQGPILAKGKRFIKSLSEEESEDSNVERHNLCREKITV